MNKNYKKAVHELAKSTLQPPHRLRELDAKEKKDKYIIELRSKGYTYDQIKKETKYSKSMISVVLKKYVLRAQQDANLMRNPSLSKGEIQSRIFHYAPDALENIKRLSRRSKKDEVKLSASKDIMDRAGFKPVEKHALIHFVDTMNRTELMEGIQSILNSIRSRGNGSPSIINVDPIETGSQR